jgi:hypothetical protein
LNENIGLRRCPEKDVLLKRTNIKKNIFVTKFCELGDKNLPKHTPETQVSFVNEAPDLYTCCKQVLFWLLFHSLSYLLDSFKTTALSQKVDGLIQQNFLHIPAYETKTCFPQVSRKLWNTHVKKRAFLRQES